MNPFAALVIGALGMLTAAPAVSAPAQPPGGAVAFRNDLPATYELRRVRFWVDGALRYEGHGAFAAPVPTGPHVVSIAAEYRMRDPALPYVRGYSIELRSAEHIRSRPARVARARAVETGDATTPVERRAHIRWR
jgi:hypothetical protein